jgi:hypothetical protein
MMRSERRRIFLIALLWLVPLALYYIIQPFLFYGMPDGDVYLYHRLALQLTQGQLPFVDYFFEYPPASILVFAIPALFTTVAAEYVVVYQLLSWGLMVAITYLLISLFDVVQVRGISKLHLFGYMSISSWIVIQLAINRFDTFSAFFTILGFVLYLKGIHKDHLEYRTYGILSIIFATLIKLYPLFLLPFFGLYELKNCNWKAIRLHSIASIIFSLPFMVWMLIGFRGLLFFLGYHSDRGLEIESSWATLVLFINQISGNLNLLDHSVVYEFASIGIRSEFADTLAAISLRLYAAVLILSALFFLLKLTKENAIELLMHAGAVVMIGFPVFNKVFSAQYVVWLIPFIVLYLGAYLPKVIKPWRTSIIITVYTAVSTVLIFPIAWGWYTDGNVFLTTVLFVRNILLVGVTGFAVYQLFPKNLSESWTLTYNLFKKEFLRYTR